MQLLSTNKDVKLVALSDIHIGAASHKGKHFARTLRYIRDNPDCFWGYGGDGMENVTPDKDGGMQAEQRMSPTKQFHALYGHFKDIADKCLYLVAGNHEWRSMKTASLDLTEMLAYQLNLADRYIGPGGLHSIKVGKNVYRIAVYHGHQSNISNKFLENQKRFLIHPTADVVMLGHTHHLGHTPQVVLDEDDKGKEVARCVHFVRTGNYLGYAEYARISGYTPGRVGSPILTFSSKEKHVAIDDNTLAAI